MFVLGYETPTTFSTDLYTDSNENEYNIDEVWWRIFFTRFE